MSKIGKVVKKVASVALPIAASFIPGIGPLGMALAGAAGGALGGGGIKGALLGGLTSGLGAGMFGAAPAASQGGIFGNLNNSIYNTLSPLRSIGSSISSGIGDAISPLSKIFDSGASATHSAAPISGGITSRNLPILSASKNAAYSPGSFMSHFDKVAQPVSSGSGIGDFISDLFPSSLGDFGKLASLAQSIGGANASPKGTQSQQDILNQMNADKEKISQQNANFMQALNSAPMQRPMNTAPVDYYSYGSRPEFSFFNNNELAPKFAKGGEVKIKNSEKVISKRAASPLDQLKGQADTIDAKVSLGEYVIPADVVSGLGDGNTSAGAKQLDNLIKGLRTHKAPAMKKGKLPPKAKSPLSYIGAMA